jgi:serine/threonine-protein phosphatase 2A activator
MTSTQVQPSKAALDSLSSRLWDSSGKKGSPLPPLGTRTVGSNPPAQQPAIQPSTAPSSSSSAASAATPLPPVEKVPCPGSLTAEELKGMTFEAPKKRIVSQAHLEKWKNSTVFEEILGFIMCCNDAVVGKKLNEPVQGQDSPAVKSIIDILDRVAILVNETPAEENSASRFGNPAFRTLYSKIQSESQKMSESIPGMKKEAIVEVERYFVECFGNEKRIDYGSGMELNFACWL